MKIKDIVECIETIAPLSYQEDYDNAGLIVGNENDEISGVLLCLDVTEEVVEEAIQKKCSLVISHHPTVFKGIKKLNGNNSIERILIHCIKNNIALYAAHTNLDNVLQHGVNTKIAEKLNLQDVKILKPLHGDLLKMTVYCPEKSSSTLIDSLFAAGAGKIGNYSECAFVSQGTGSFKPNVEANPTIGSSGIREYVQENKIEFIFEKYKRKEIWAALRANHPYEEIAYQEVGIQNTNQDKGSGVIGMLNTPMQAAEFLTYLKNQMGLECIKYTKFSSSIRKIALCGGSGKFLLQEAMKQGADAFISADFKYHDYFESEGKLMICDIGHYESEVYTKEIFMKLLKEKFTNFAVHFSEINTNPVNYYY